jgi:RHS repeat-associated protein
MALGLKLFIVYDKMGNEISEYEQIGTGSINWSRDYVYGAGGEAVYMQMPSSTAMNAAFEDYLEFAEAWLCSPSCTTAELVWDTTGWDDVNDQWDSEDGQVDFYDFIHNGASFEGMYDINANYLLTDYKGSVIAISDEYGDTDEIAYDAWGNATVAQGVDLNGLSILWNGYYYDYETGNYYLKNRYYSPVERSFITEDPHGVNPDGNWNNFFAPLNQYRDGFGLSVYAGSDPVNMRDDWGLWKYALEPAQRSKEARTFVEAASLSEYLHNIKGLAQYVRLNEDEFDKWGERDVVEINGKKRCGAWVPNTVLAYWAGELGGFGKGWVKWNKNIKYYEAKGYRIDENSDWLGYQFSNYLRTETQSKNLYGIYFWGHGFNNGIFYEPWVPWDPFNWNRDTLWLGLVTKSGVQSPLYATPYSSWKLSYKLGLGYMNACGTEASRKFFSDDAIFEGATNVLIPIGGPTAERIETAASR